MSPQTAWFECTMRFLPTSPEELETVRKASGGRIQQQARRLDGVAGDHDIARLLEAPPSLSEVVHAGRASVSSVLYSTCHGEISDLGACRECTWQPGDEYTLFGVGGATDDAHSAIDAWMRETPRRGQSGQRCRCPVDSERLGAACENQCRRVQLMGAIRIAGSRWAPGVTDGA